MSGYARWLAGMLGAWADSDGRTNLGWAIDTASKLLDELERLDAEATARRLWDDPARLFARTRGCCLHVRDCFYVLPDLGYEPLTREEAEAYLRESHDHRRCAVCAPAIPEAPWARVVSAGGQVRWRLADSGRAAR